MGFNKNKSCGTAGIIGNVIYKGIINVPADFPTLAEVQVGWEYTVGTDVTDSDPTRTNTGQSFIAGDEVRWAGTLWAIVGQERLWLRIAGELVPFENNDVKIQTGKNYLIGNNPVNFSQNKELFVRKNGSGTNGGLTQIEAVQTLNEAITIAAGLTPSINNQIFIQILDAENYAENITLPEFVHISGENATFSNGTHNIVLNNNTSVKFKDININDLTKSGIGAARFDCDKFVTLGEIINIAANSTLYGNVTNNFSANTLTQNGAYTNIRTVERAGGTDIQDGTSNVLVENLSDSYYTQKAASRLTTATVVKHPVITAGPDNLPSFNTINVLASTTGTATFNLKNPTATYNVNVTAANAAAIASAINGAAGLNTRVLAQAIGALVIIFATIPGDNNDWTLVLSQYTTWTRNFEHFIGGGTNKIVLNGEVVVSFRSQDQETPRIYELRKTYTNFEVTDPYASPSPVTPGSVPVTTFRFTDNSGILDIAFDPATPPTENASLYPYFGVASHPTLTNIEYFAGIAYKTTDYLGSALNSIRGIGLMKQEGNFLFRGIATTLQLQKTGGKIYGPGISPLNPLASGEKTYSPVSPVTFFYAWRISAADLTSFNVNPYQTLIDPNRYDDGTGKGNNGLPKGIVTSNNWTNQYIYMEGVQNIDGIAFYGQAQYATETLALQNRGKDFTPPLIVAALQLSEILTVQQGTGDLTLPAKATFLDTNKFFQVAGAGGNTTVIFSPVLYENMYYISPSIGSDTNSGKSDELPIKTLTHGITLAIAQTPSNIKQFNLYTVEAAQIGYLFTLTSWLHLHAENTVFTQKITLDAVNGGDYNSARLGQIKCALASDFALILDGAGTKRVYLREGLNNTATSAKGIHVLQGSNAIIISDGGIYASGLEAIKLELNATADLHAPTLHGYISVGSGSKLTAIIDKTISAAEISMGNGAVVKLGGGDCDFIANFIAASTDSAAKLFITGATAQRMDFAGFKGEVYLKVAETDQQIVFSGNKLDAKFGRLLYHGGGFTIGNNAQVNCQIAYIDRPLGIGSGATGTVTIGETGANFALTNNSPVTCQVIVLNDGGEMQIGAGTSGYMQINNSFGTPWLTINGAIARMTLVNGQIVGVQDFEASRGVIDTIEKGGRNKIVLATSDTNYTANDNGAEVSLAHTVSADRSISLPSETVPPSFNSLLFNYSTTYELHVLANGNTLISNGTTIPPWQVAFLRRDKDSATTFYLTIS